MNVTMTGFLPNYSPFEKFKFQREYFGRFYCDPKISAFDEEADLYLVERIKEYLLNNSKTFEKYSIYFPTFSKSYAQATIELSNITLKKISLLLCNSLFSKYEISEPPIPKDVKDKILIIWSTLTVFIFPSCEDFQIKIWGSLKFYDGYQKDIEKSFKNSKKMIL